MSKALPGEIDHADVTDSLIDLLEGRVVAIEAVMAARGWRRFIAAWRLGRSLRASVQPFEGSSFAERRYEAVSIEWGSAQAPGREAGEMAEDGSRPSSRQVTHGRPETAPVADASKPGFSGVLFGGD